MKITSKLKRVIIRSTFETGVAKFSLPPIPGFKPAQRLPNLASIFMNFVFGGDIVGFGDLEMILLDLLQIETQGSDLLSNNTQVSNWVNKQKDAGKIAYMIYDKDDPKKGLKLYIAFDKTDKLDVDFLLKIAETSSDMGTKEL